MSKMWRAPPRKYTTLQSVQSGVSRDVRSKVHAGVTTVLVPVAIMLFRRHRSLRVRRKYRAAQNTPKEGQAASSAAMVKQINDNNQLWGLRVRGMLLLWTHTASRSQGNLASTTTKGTCSCNSSSRTGLHFHSKMHMHGSTMFCVL